MATVVESTRVINAKSLVERIKSIEESYKGRSLQALEYEVKHFQKQCNNPELSERQRSIARSCLKDADRNLESANAWHALLNLSRTLVLADQLKQDYDHTVNQVVEAIESTEEREVSIEILGDVIPARVRHYGEVWIHDRTEDSFAFYKIS